MINLRNALMSGKRKPTAKDYFGFSDSVFFYDGIENAGLGVHVDTLPVAYGYQQWKNLAPSAATFAYNTDMNVVSMTPTANSLSFSTDSAWAAWGQGFNTAQISSENAEALLTQIFGGLLSAEYTCELVFKNTVTPTGTCPILAGYNERILYGKYGSAGTTWLWRFSENRNGTETQVYQNLSSLSLSPAMRCFAFTQSASGSKFYSNGTAVFTRTTYPGARFFRNMVAIKRTNTVQTVLSQGEVFALRIYNRILTADEIAANYAIDKARFGLT